MNKLAEQWIRENLKVVSGWLPSDAIMWGNNSLTEIPNFISMFGSVIETAIANGTDVRQAIAENDNGRGYANLILN